MIRVGDAVKLSAARCRTHRCPEGREDNKTAKVRCRCPNIRPGAVMMDRDLQGCRWRNVADLGRT